MDMFADSGVFGNLNREMAQNNESPLDQLNNREVDDAAVAPAGKSGTGVQDAERAVVPVNNSMWRSSGMSTNGLLLGGGLFFSGLFPQSGFGLSEVAFATGPVQLARLPTSSPMIGPKQFAQITPETQITTVEAQLLVKAASKFEAFFVSALIAPPEGQSLDAYKGLLIGEEIVFFSPEKLAQAYDILLDITLALARGEEISFKKESQALAKLSPVKELPDDRIWTKGELKEIARRSTSKGELPSLSDVSSEESDEENLAFSRVNMKERSRALVQEHLAKEKKVEQNKAEFSLQTQGEIANREVPELEQFPLDGFSGSETETEREDAGDLAVRLSLVNLGATRVDSAPASTVWHKLVPLPVSSQRGTPSPDDAFSVNLSFVDKYYDAGDVVNRDLGWDTDAGTWEEVFAEENLAGSPEQPAPIGAERKARATAVSPVVLPHSFDVLRGADLPAARSRIPTRREGADLAGLTIEKPEMSGSRLKAPEPGPCAPKLAPDVNNPEAKTIGSWESIKKSFIIIQDGDCFVIKVCKVFALVLAVLAFPITLTVRALLYFYDSCCAERVNSNTGTTVKDEHAVKA